MTSTGTPLTWSALPAQVQAQAWRHARAGQPHPDPAVRAAVVTRSRRRRDIMHRVIMIQSAALLAIVIALPVGVAIALRSPDANPGWEFIPFAALCLCLTLTPPTIAAGALAVGSLADLRLDAPNTAAYLADSQVAVPAFTTYARGFAEPGAAFAAILAAVPISTALTMLFVLRWAQAEPVWPIPLAFFVLSAVPLWTLGYLIARVSPRRGVVAEFTAEGVRVPPLGLSLDWTEIARVDAVPPSGKTVACCLVLRDPAIAGRVGGPWLRRRMVLAELRRSGVLILPPIWARDPVDVVVAGARGVHRTVLTAAGTAQAQTA